jgi:hypothetical protein
VQDSTVAGLIAEATVVAGSNGALRLVLLRLSRRRPEDAASRRAFDALMPPREGAGC